MPSRQQMWDALPEEVDLIIVGGGVNGCGAARDAARRGLKVALFEKNDLAYGTSSRSSKLVHGGMRYLESYEFSLVFESVSERRILLDLAPHLVNPLGFLFPVFSGARHGIWTISAGMWLYDGLSLFRSPKRRRRLKPKQVAKEEPALIQEGLLGAPLYYDCSTDDARLTIETALDAAEQGAVIATWCRVDAFLKDDQGRVNGVVVKNQRDGSLREVKASAVINATGPWTDETMAMSGPRTRKLLRATKGIHIVVNREQLPVNHAVVCFHPEDGRTLFALPWGEQTYVGTTDTDYEGRPDDVHATLSDVDYLIDVSNAYFPQNQISRDDVIATWSGLRPLVAPDANEGEAEDEVSESKISREHQIIVGQDGLITIAGGKLTTFRRMAAELVDTAVKLLQLSDKLPSDLKVSNSEKAPLPGAVGWPEDDDHQRVADEVFEASKGTLGAASARLLADTYGMRAIEIAKACAATPPLGKPLIAGRPEIAAQIDWAVNEEFAASVSDVMIRRTQLFYRDADQGLGIADVVGQRMAQLIGWTDDEKQASVEAYRQDVALSRRWREEVKVANGHARAPAGEVSA